MNDLTQALAAAREAYITEAAQFVEMDSKPNPLFRPLGDLLAAIDAQPQNSDKTQTALDYLRGWNDRGKAPQAPPAAVPEAPYPVVAELMAWVPAKWENGQPFTEDDARAALNYTMRVVARPEQAPPAAREALKNSHATANKRPHWLALEAAMSDLLAALDAQQPVELEWRWKETGDGPGLWTRCDLADIDLIHAKEGCEVRALYAAPQAPPAAVADDESRDVAVWSLIAIAEQCGATKDEGDDGRGPYWSLNLDGMYALEAKMRSAVSAMLYAEAAPPAARSSTVAWRWPEGNWQDGEPDERNRLLAEHCESTLELAYAAPQAPPAAVPAKDLAWWAGSLLIQCQQADVQGELPDCIDGGVMDKLAAALAAPRAAAEAAAEAAARKGE